MTKQIKLGLLLFFFAGTLFSQNKEIELNTFAGVSFPTGNFGKMIEQPIEVTRRNGLFYGDDVGLATTGFTAGIEVFMPAFVNGLGWLINTNVIVNPTDASSLETEFNKDPKVTGNLSIESGSWINVPLLAGLSYGFAIVKDFNIYFEALGGINYSSHPSFTATMDGTIVEERKYDSVTDFGFEAGIAFDYLEDFTLTARYVNLGSPRYDGTQYLNEKLFTDIIQRDNTIIGEENSIEMFVITFGYKF